MNRFRCLARPAALAYVVEFVEQSKKSGTVAIETAELRGVRVAPAAQ